MRALLRGLKWPALSLVVVLALGLTLGLASCGSGGTGWNSVDLWGFSTTGTAGTSIGYTGTFTGGTQGGSAGTTDPCDETLSRKFVTITMRSYAGDYVHYFFFAIAFVHVADDATEDEMPVFDQVAYNSGAVCEADIGLYQQHGYNFVDTGQHQALGDYCLRGPALYYFHDNGDFRVAAGSSDSGLGSAIAPGQGDLPTYDNFFTSAGAQLPVPDMILFHNPGTGNGAALKISVPTPNPCNIIITAGDAQCSRDSFYYVTYDDIMVGSRSLGPNSGRRVPSDIQGTGCKCLGNAEAFQPLAPPGVRGAAAKCNQFFRGGRIDFAFFEDDSTPQFPQLVWHVTDGAGTVVHDYDPLSPLGQ